ncbi:MAG: hypothetical protein JRF33_08795 [Deltaproteobacteria bacterium]|nr:hypothetical protein [Deltaproteobacteria bacterium]
MRGNHKLNLLPSFGRKADPTQPLTRIGSGELGGKASGLSLVQQEVLSGLDMEGLDGLSVDVPRATILTTDLFESFCKRNKLTPTDFADMSDDRIAHTFQRADLPSEWVGDLRALSKASREPLAVRSSSLLEDALDHPFAGVYGTKMIPNSHPDPDRRFRALVEAIKFVYATTFFRGAQDLLRAKQLAPDSEKMAVLVQEVVGQRCGDRFYPTLSGVARSFNHYPTGHGKPEDGVVNLALGLGCTIVDGGLSWTYCPAYPKAPPPFNGLGDMLDKTQTRFWSVHMGKPPVPDPIHETEHLVEAGLLEAEADGWLAHLVSTYDAGSDRLWPGLAPQGARVLDFSPLLQLRILKLNDLIRRLLDRSAEVLGSAVEMEFAVNLSRKKPAPARFGFLQVRPMRVFEASVEVATEQLTGPDVLLASEQVLGHGARDDIFDVVYLKPGVFDPAKTRLMAGEIDELNRSLLAQGRPYLLVGFGRWGSSDPWLGVPVLWSQIGGAAVIVEASLPKMNPDPSQGSHFFHNLIGFQVCYLTVPHMGRHRIDFDWLDAQPAEKETEHARHVRLDRPLSVRVDAGRRRGVVSRS